MRKPESQPAEDTMVVRERAIPREAPKKERDTRPLGEIGKQDFEHAVDSVKKSWGGFKDMLGKGKDWVTKKAVDVLSAGLGVALHPQEATTRAAETVAGAGKYAGGKGLEAGKYVGGKVAEAGKYMGGKAVDAGRFVSEKTRAAYEATANTAKESYDALVNKGQEAYTGARDRISAAKASFDQWRDERRMKKALKEKIDTAGLEDLQTLAFFLNGSTPESQ